MSLNARQVDLNKFSGYVEFEMKVSIKSSELQDLSPEAQAEQLQKFVKVLRSRPNGEARELNLRIAEFERKLGLSSDALRRELAQGKRKETWDVCLWLMLLDQRDMLGFQSSRAD